TVNSSTRPHTITLRDSSSDVCSSDLNYTTAPDTATTADYTTTSGTLTFGPGTGTRTQSVTVPITNDTLYEKSEQFFLNLSAPTRSEERRVGNDCTILYSGTGQGSRDN